MGCSHWWYADGDSTATRTAASAYWNARVVEFAHGILVTCLSSPIKTTSNSRCPTVPLRTQAPNSQECVEQMSGLGRGRKTHLDGAAHTS